MYYTFKNRGHVKSDTYLNGSLAKYYNMNRRASMAQENKIFFVICRTQKQDFVIQIPLIMKIKRSSTTLDMSMCSVVENNQENKADLVMMSVLRGRRVAGLLPSARSAVQGSASIYRQLAAAARRYQEVSGGEMFGGNGRHSRPSDSC